jgi:hypothetical protein
MTPAGPREWFPQFYDNPAIQALATACRWTISGQLGGGDEDDDEQKRKAPIDVRHLLDGCTQNCRHVGPLRGAFALDRTCLLTLEELSREIPEAANAAFYLQAQTDGLLVIDIEPDCPQQIATDLLRLPGILYSELSMSGRGFHLLAPLPGNLHEFPIAASKRVLREEHGWYELLLDHWVTFTRSSIPDHIVDRVAVAPRPPRPASLEELYAELAAKARESANVSAVAVSTEGSMPDVPHAAKIVEQTLASARDRLRGQGDFGGDMSRWEFSVLGTLHHWMQVPLRAHSAFGATYSAGDQAWLLYQAVLDVIPPRPKHAQLRNGRPYLLDRAAALVAEREAAEGGAGAAG